MDQFNHKIAGLIDTKIPNSNRSLFLKPYADSYLYGKYEDGIQSGGRIEYVRLFSIIAIFILVIACINFMNLATAKAAGRVKEVGIKKVIGASRYSLIMQFMGESMVMAFLSVILAILLVWLSIPAFNGITGKHLIFQPDTNLILSVLVITVVTGLLAGSYPALYLSGFNPVTVLKEKLKSSPGELWIRKGLVIFQFTISVIFIVSVLVVYRQMKLIQSKNLGYNRDHIIYFEAEGKMWNNPAPFLSEMKKMPGIVNVSGIDRLLTGSFNTTGGVDWPGKTPGQTIPFEIARVNYDLIEMLGIQMKEGRSFSRNFGADTSKIIFNEAAIEAMGLKNPIGKIVKLWGNDMEVVGVTQNFNFESLHENIKPLFFLLKPEDAQFILVKMKVGQEKQVIAGLQKAYATYNPGFTLDYKFMDGDYQALYEPEQRVAVLSRYFAGLAIIISCVGLFGLAAFTAQRRQKEIGIRKVVGASLSQIATMLSADFLKLVIISVLIAFPLAWWIANQWLQSFAYHIHIGVVLFLLAGGATLFITLFTISFQAIKSAMANPVKSLRAE